VSGPTISAIFCKRSSGTGTTPTFGSMVQNGKFAACAPAFVIALNRVLLPTLGRPTIPHCNAICLTFGHGSLLLQRSDSSIYLTPSRRDPCPNYGAKLCLSFGHGSLLLQRSDSSIYLTPSRRDPCPNYGAKLCLSFGHGSLLLQRSDS